MSVRTRRSWTAAVRERAVAALPPEKLLAEKQPSYVSSWIYVLGVLSLASLTVIILSGSILALKGPAWWHVTGVGHFFNSIHLWSVELFFFFMVIHLWGKYWMAAWRGGRKRTWVTGAVTFLVAIPCALTGYVSQQNFDAQWISTQAKDAMNSAGIGAFFNLLNFGQMYSYHVLLLPAAVVALVIAHVLLVRKHGVVPPFELRERVLKSARATDSPGVRAARAMSRRERLREEDEAARMWRGGYRSYDLVKEFSIALGVVLAIAVVLTVLFSSPDDPPSTIKQWSRSDPVDFVTTAVSELDGTSGTATYGPPYNHNGPGQYEWFIHLQKWFGVSHPVNTAKDFVLAPLSSITGQPRLTNAISSYQHATAKQQAAWTAAYTKALGKARVGAGDSVSVPAGNYGPVSTLMGSLLTFAQAGGLGGALLTSRQFYQTDYTKPLLFMADGGLLASRAMTQHLLGTQWGIMNETGSYPGQVWLWLYTFWYQIKPFSTSANADILVMTIMAALSLGLILIPLIPGVNDLPRWIPIYKLIWRNHYSALEGSR